MAQSRKLINDAQEILNLLEDEKIDSSNIGLNLTLIRSMCLDVAKNSGMMAPGLTQCVATTLLKVGLCQELSQRFVLEYILKYTKQNVSIIFASNPTAGYTSYDHAFVFIGDVRAPNELFLGRNSSVSGSVIVEPERINQDLNEFFAENGHGVFADPLLHCVGISHSELAPLHEYFIKHNLTHIIGVRSYADTPNLIASTKIIKENAIVIAKQLEPIIEKTRSIKLLQISGKEQHADKNKSKLKGGFFNTPSSNSDNNNSDKIPKGECAKIDDTLHSNESDKCEIQKLQMNRGNK